MQFRGIWQSRNPDLKALSPPNGTIWGHLARCRLDAGGCCSLKFNLSSSFPSLLGAQRTSQSACSRLSSLFADRRATIRRGASTHASEGIYKISTKKLDTELEVSGWAAA